MREQSTINNQQSTHNTLVNTKAHRTSLLPATSTSNERRRRLYADPRLRYGVSKYRYVGDFLGQCSNLQPLWLAAFNFDTSTSCSCGAGDADGVGTGAGDADGDVLGRTPATPECGRLRSDAPLRPCSGGAAAALLPPPLDSVTTMYSSGTTSSATFATFMRFIVVQSAGEFFSTGKHVPSATRKQAECKAANVAKNISRFSRMLGDSRLL